MAEISSIFKIKGRIGNTIFSGRDGKFYARAVPESVKNPNTEKQQVTRNRFRVAVRFYQRLKETPLEEIWSRAGKNEKLSGFALFMRENLKMFDHRGKIADFEGLRLATGKRYGVHDLSASVDADDRVSLGWRGDSDSACPDHADRLMVVLLYGNRAFSPELVEGLDVTRGEGKATFALHREPGIPVHVYCFFVTPFGNAFSDSQHMVV